MQIEKISRKAFDSLGEYSISYPTLTTIGKVWKCMINPMDESKGWWICEYVDIGKADKVGIDRRIAQIIEDPNDRHPTVSKPKGRNRRGKKKGV